MTEVVMIYAYYFAIFKMSSESRNVPGFPHVFSIKHQRKAMNAEIYFETHAEETMRLAGVLDWRFFTNTCQYHLVKFTFTRWRSLGVWTLRVFFSCPLLSMFLSIDNVVNCTRIDVYLAEWGRRLHVNEVAQRRARLLLGWVTVRGFVRCSYVASHSGKLSLLPFIGLGNEE